MSYGFETILELDGKELDVTVCSYSFRKEINEDGDVASKTQGGIIYLSLTDIPQDNVIAWGMEHRQWKEGKIKIINTENGGQIAAEEISFENAACVNIKINYERNQSGYFTTLLTISAQNIRVGKSGVWINKDWVLDN